MARLILIFIAVFLMVMQAHADPRGGHGWGGGGRGWGGGGNWSRPNVGPVWRPRYYGDHGTGFAGGVIGGAIGSWLWNQWAQPPAPVVVEQPPVIVQQGATIEWCIQRYRSYNPETRTYLGFDGQFHGCP